MDAILEYKPERGVVTLAVLLLAMSGLAQSARADNDDDDGPAPVAQVLTAAGRTLQIPPEVQQQAGITVARLQAARMLPERETQAQVVDVGPLLQARWQYRDAQAQWESARATLARTQAALDRLEALRRNPDDVSTRQMLDAETARDESAAQVRAADARRQSLREAVLREWGEDIFASALADGAAGAGLFTGQALLLVAVGATGMPLGMETRARAAASGSGDASVAVTLLGPASMAAATLPGAAWFGLVPAQGFRVGAHVRVWLAADTAPQNGVHVPRAAVIWHGGAPWLYRRVDATHFARHGLSGASDFGDGWFVPAADLAGADVVVTGAQTLLSEELRAQIPDEDDDP